MLGEGGCKAILLLSSFLVGARERRSKRRLEGEIKKSFSFPL
jgi:hypothetical protein